MSFYSVKVVSGAAIALLACLAAAQAGVARPLQTSGTLLAQVNVPPEEGVPPLITEEVQGRITKIEGNKVEVRLSSGELRTYTIPPADQERNSLKVGDNVVMSVRGDTVLAIGPSSTTSTTGSSGMSGSSSGTSGTVRSGQSSSSSSSSTTVRRETTVQSQTRPAPAPAPAAQPAPQPVRGLW